MELALYLCFLRKKSQAISLLYREIHFTAILLICKGGRLNLPLKALTKTSLVAYMPGRYHWATCIHTFRDSVADEKKPHKSAHETCRKHLYTYKNKN